MTRWVAQQAGLWLGPAGCGLSDPGDGVTRDCPTGHRESHSSDSTAVRQTVSASVGHCVSVTESEIRLPGSK